MIDLSVFFSIQENLVNLLKTKHRRHRFDKINWKNRLIGLIGNRGTGKTTLLLQYLTQYAGDRSQILYISADHIRIEAVGLWEIASQFFKLGGRVLIIDEIHKYNNWPQEVKNIYDAFPTARILISGSSSLKLQLGKTDLSRRETFFFHQLKSAGLQVRIPDRGDFLVQNKFLFEVGGKAKDKRQIAGRKDAYLVKDDIDIGLGNVIPLWVFGCLY